MDQCKMCDGGGKMPDGDRCEHCNGNGIKPPPVKDNPRAKQSIPRPARGG